VHIVGYAPKRQFFILRPDQDRRQVLAEQPLHDREYRLFLRVINLQNLGNL